ncbi:LPXTG cell wall anchor domain-containing protein [Streptomyces sp. WG-D5]
MTAPVALLSVSPAYADTKPAAQTQEQSSIAELKKAVKEAKKAYKQALATVQTLKDELEASTAADHPLMIALADAQKAADEAATAKTTADEAVTAAEAKLAEANAGEDAEAKAAAEKALADAKTAAEAAATAKTDADAKVVAADTAVDDNRVAIARKIHQAQQDVKAALETKEAAEKALADALEQEPGEPGNPGEPGEPGDECTEGSDLTAAISGLPSKIAAGSTVDFRLRLTNTTEKTLETVLPFVAVGAVDKTGEKDISSKLHLKSKQGNTWKTVDQESYAAEFTNVKPGAHADLPLRLTIDRSAPAGYGVSMAIGEYFNEDYSCGISDLAVYDFTINPVGAGNSGTATPNKPKPQGSASPVANAGSDNGSADTDGSLAHTGSSSALPTIGLAGGAAVVLGAGAVYVVRRRKAGANS